MSENYFAVLNNINVNDKTEKKNGLTYLSWAWAWGEVKKVYPDAFYTIYENKDGWFYHTDGNTCWVKTGVTVNGIEHIEYLPVMDYKNRSIPASNVTSFDVNKAIQRSLTKACARHGLGLYVYAGEDLPEEEKQIAPPVPPTPQHAQPQQYEQKYTCERCTLPIHSVPGKGGKELSPVQIVKESKKRFNAIYCADCMKRMMEAQKQREQAGN
jgi:ribosomal protein L34E